MHSFNATSDNTWFHNGDFSGDVKVLVHSSAVVVEGALAQVTVPFSDLVELVHKYQKRQSEAAMEALRDDETVGQLARRMSGAPEYTTELKTDEDRRVPRGISESQKSFYMDRFLGREKSSAPDHQPPVRVPDLDSDVCPKCRWDVKAWSGHHSTCPDFQQPETD